MQLQVFGGWDGADEGVNTGVTDVRLPTAARGVLRLKKKQRSAVRRQAGGPLFPSSAGCSRGMRTFFGDTKLQRRSPSCQQTRFALHFRSCHIPTDPLTCLVSIRIYQCHALPTTPAAESSIKKICRGIARAVAAKGRILR